MPFGRNQRSYAIRRGVRCAGVPRSPAAADHGKELSECLAERPPVSHGSWGAAGGRSRTRRRRWSSRAPTCVFNEAGVIKATSTLGNKKPRPKPGPKYLSGFTLGCPAAVRPDHLAGRRPFRAPAAAGLASAGRRRPAVGPVCPGRPVAGRDSVGSDCS